MGKIKINDLNEDIFNKFNKVISILDVCTVVNNEIRDQDDVIQEWFNKNLGSYCIPAGINVYISKTINIPDHSVIHGGGEIHTNPTTFTGDVALTLDERVILDGIYSK